MSRLLRSAAAGLLTVVLCLGTSTGPVMADDRSSPVPTATVMPSPTETAPSETTRTETNPTETESTRPEPTETKPTETTGTGSTSTSAPTTTALATSGSASPAAPTAPVADLQLRVWFEEPSYHRTDVVLAHASVTNAGTATANQVIVSSTGNLDRDTWYPFWPEGVSLAPGETVEGSLSGFVSNDEDTVRLVVTVAQRAGEPDANPEDNTVSVSAPVLTWPGSYRGTIFGDRDGDRVVDPGEGLAGISVRIETSDPNLSRTRTTDANGAFAFLDLPPGRYRTSLSADGWYLEQPPVDVDGVDDPDVLIRGVPMLHGRMAASMVFTRQSYREGDLARAVLTVRNTSEVVLTDLVAECGVLLPLPYRPVGADAGELSPDGPGVVLPAGATREFAVTVPVTQISASTGHLRLSCRLGRRSGDSFGREIIALAHVAGGVAPRVTGTLWEEKSQFKGQPLGDRLPGVKIYLRDQVDGKVVARDVTDSAGNFTFLDVPAGLYHWGLVGPWQITHGGWWAPVDDKEVIIRTGENGLSPHIVWVKPGPYQPDPDPVPPGGGEPVPAPSPVAGQPPLAATGAGATRLALSGVLTLLLGAGLVLLARRRPHGPGSCRT